MLNQAEPDQHDALDMFLNIGAIIVAALLIVVILLQMQGQGLSSSFGGGGEFYRSKQSLDRLLIFATVILTTLFGVLSVILLIPR
ncbi:MAG: preprotein translocase subunit SecG [Patescibacteria group bacterium]